MSPIPTCLPSEALLTQSLPLLSQGDPAQVIMGRPECLSPTWSPWPFQLCTHQHTSQYITTDHHPSSQLFSPHGSSQHSLACHLPVSTAGNRSDTLSCPKCKPSSAHMPTPGPSAQGHSIGSCKDLGEAEQPGEGGKEQFLSLGMLGSKHSANTCCLH